MRCRYCGAENPDHELRCVKCQRRVAGANPLPSPDHYPIIETATAPDLAPQRAPVQAPAPPRPLLAVPRTGAPRAAAPVQSPLFPCKVVPGERSAPHNHPRSADPGRSAPRRKVTTIQSAFEFDAPQPPGRPLTRQLDRRTDFPVAPLRLRAMAAIFDAGLVMGFVSLFLLTVRLTLGFLPLQTPFLFCYAGAALAIAGTYKLLWCMFGQVTLGILGAHLNVVSFDGQRPTVAQRFMRMFAGWLSLLSAGMGVLWALADQEKLAWHDHISQTFLTHQPPETEA